MADNSLSSDVEIPIGVPEPLVPDDGGCGGELDLHFDEYGSPAEPLDLGGEGGRPHVPCSLRALNGSWLLELVPEQFGFPFQVIRGPMRIEASAARFRVSGDVYVRSIGNAPPNSPGLESPILPGMLIGKNWYPAYPQSQYRWYFRSQGVGYTDGILSFPFARHLWDPAQQEFTGQDTGQLRLTCRRTVLTPTWAPQPTLRMTGRMAKHCQSSR